MRTVQTVAVIGAVLVAMPMFAQTVPAPPPPPRPPAAPPAPTPPRLQILRRQMIRDDSSFRNRPTLGMSLSTTGTKRDTIGVFVTRVVPNGPAERAGIIEGDRIAAIDDINLKANPADLDDPYAMGLPAHRISHAVSKMTPGATVKLRVYSNGRYRDVTVTTGRMGDVYRGREGIMMFSGADLGGMIGPTMAQIRPSLEMIGPAIRDELVPELDRIGPEMERIGPEVQRNIERAMRAVPRDIHVEVNDDRNP